VAVQRNVTRVRLVLVATQDRPGEYLVVDAATRTVLYGPFYSDANPAVVADRISRQLKIEDSSLPVEWS
jgi:hypothetical protein